MDKSAIIKALRDGAQSASNGVANTMVGDPVDILASGLRYAGVPVGDTPVGGTAWLAQQGLTAPVDETSVPGMVGKGLGLAAGGMMFTPGKLKEVIQGYVK
jgi:hypothetical protein